MFKNRKSKKIEINIVPKPTNKAFSQNTTPQTSNMASQNEQQLYNEWKNMQLEKETAINKANQLQLQLEKLIKINEELQIKYAELEKKINQTSERKTTEKVEYHTDEEELAEETEWIRTKNRKKRRMDTSLTPPQSQNVPNSAATNINLEKPQKKYVPPPIIVDDVKNFNEIHDMVKKVPNTQIKVINDKNIKINVQNEADFKTFANALNENGYSWYSYENKQNRPIKVMANKLYHTVKPEDIVNEMKKRGYKLLEATPKLQYKTKKPLNMFMLSFRHDESVDKIYNITDILGIRVEILPLRKSRLVPQCKRCQSYGHTQKYCAKEPRCVRCTGKHLTINCDKPKNHLPKCIHCGEGHPANYRGCMIAKELQKIKDKRAKNPVVPKAQQRVQGVTDSTNEKKINIQRSNSWPDKTNKPRG